MSRPYSFLLGPEALWLLFYLGVGLLVRANQPPSKAMDNTLVNLAFVVPLVLIPMTFALGWLPFVDKKWLLVRTVLVCFFGCHFVLSKGLAGHSEQGPGVGTAYIMGMGFAIVVIFAGSIVRLIWGRG